MRFSSYRADTIFVMHKVQRAITPKVKKAELPFLHSAHHLMLIDICIKFHEYSLSGFQVIEWTRFVTDRQTDRQTDGRTGKNNMSPDPEGGRHNCCFMILQLSVSFLEWPVSGGVYCSAEYPYVNGGWGA